MEFYHHSGGFVAGCDEAGRGCLAGPVVAAAVILPDDFFDADLDDSKKLSERKRDRLRQIIEREALAWAVAECSPAEIDQMNILRASITAMHRALDQLTKEPELLLIDGNRFYSYRGIRAECVVKGDGRYSQIAAASILAKTHRDERMLVHDAAFPAYRWRENKGYPTVAHRRAISEFGETEQHRKSFKLLDDQFRILFD
jgi:ribonuclease HII